METQKIKTAVVILNWNGKDWLEKFLPNVISNSEDSEVIIVASLCLAITFSPVFTITFFSPEYTV